MNVEYIIAHAFGIAVGIVITLMVQKVGRDAEKSAERRYQVEKAYLDSFTKPVPVATQEQPTELELFTFRLNRAGLTDAEIYEYVENKGML